MGTIGESLYYTIPELLDVLTEFPYLGAILDGWGGLTDSRRQNIMALWRELS